METMAPPTSVSTQGSPRRPVRRGLVLGAVVALVAGFALGAAWTSRHDRDTWHSATAYTGMRQISIEYDGWTYGAVGSVPAWIDGQGVIHDAGWPSCLRGAGREVAVRFQAREVTVDGTTWRPIVAIDCRG